MAEQKTHVPAPAIFQSDPTEQIFSKGVLDRDMSGLSYMFLNAAQGRRDADQQTYMQGVSEANRIAAALNSQDNLSKMLIESLKEAPNYAKAGLPVSDVPMLSRLFANGGNNKQTADASLLVNLLKQSEINKNNATAGAESAPEFTGESVVTPQGVSVENLKVKQKGGDPAMVQEMLRRRQIQAQSQRGIQGTGPGGTGVPNGTVYDPRITQEYQQTRGARFGN